eukprot:CAMPEP_0168403516 /NCGR_PEP_ID=MMETSP0228-20121227/24166_1 /TAXON_ID=133427 /ORGANISM="Protoceratium reticulatum, Strain CCCM 535 (=CCMP 1889)" /LENGTH=136 /DNA_ID=CAMNT_0008417115 /DNA_START=38 /DNA_END=444 /DNA_ORIENTATION=+
MTLEKPERRIPYVSIGFITAAGICHTLVLAGNLHTVDTLHGLGTSSGGWAAVGVNLASSVDDLARSVSSVSESFTSGLKIIVEVEDALEAIFLNASSVIDAIGAPHGVTEAASLRADVQSLMQLELLAAGDGAAPG